MKSILLLIGLLILPVISEAQTYSYDGVLRLYHVEVPGSPSALPQTIVFNGRFTHRSNLWLLRWSRIGNSVVALQRDRRIVGNAYSYTSRMQQVYVDGISCYWTLTLIGSDIGSRISGIG